MLLIDAVLEICRFFINFYFELAHLKLNASLRKCVDTIYVFRSDNKIKTFLQNNSIIKIFQTFKSRCNIFMLLCYTNKTFMVSGRIFQCRSSCNHINGEISFQQLQLHLIQSSRYPISNCHKNHLSHLYQFYIKW